MNIVKQILRPIYAPIVTEYRNQQRFKQQQAVIHGEVLSAMEADQTIKLIIGAGDTRYDGWIPTDIPAFDILKHGHWAELFQPNLIYRMLAEHVFEHLTTEQFEDFLRIARIYLAEDGKIRIAVPDGYHPDATYIEHVRPGGIGEGAHEHQVLYTCDLLGDLLTAQGYEFELLEYFDSQGNFHQVAWDEADGHIKRSIQHDSRNINGQPVYTSLIVDFWTKS